MSDPFVGEITMFAGNFAPRGWAFCDGQLLAINQNNALFAVIGTYFGGDGMTTFALPDLRGRVPLHMGEGPGLTNRPIGSRGGVEQVTLTTAKMPAHGHAQRSGTDVTSNAVPIDGAPIPGTAADGSLPYGPATSLTPLAPEALSSAGGGAPHPNLAPYTVVHFIIALVGIFPSRA